MKQIKYFLLLLSLVVSFSGMAQLPRSFWGLYKDTDGSTPYVSVNVKIDIIGVPNTPIPPSITLFSSAKFNNPLEDYPIVNQSYRYVQNVKEGYVFHSILQAYIVVAYDYSYILTTIDGTKIYRLELSRVNPGWSSD